MQLSESRTGTFVPSGLVLTDVIMPRNRAEATWSSSAPSSIQTGSSVHVWIREQSHQSRRRAGVGQICAAQAVYKEVSADESRSVLNGH